MNLDCLISESITVENAAIYKGYGWVITLNIRGYRCGYVAIPSNRPLYEKNLSTLKVYGGITFDKFSPQRRLIGFNSTRKEEGTVETKEYMQKQCEYLIDQIVALEMVELEKSYKNFFYLPARLH